jgi:hypothetical protein
VPTADEHLDEGAEQSRAGRGASALVTSETGLLGHLARFVGDQPFDVRMAAAFSRHAAVLHRFGDPDLAVACADLAIRTYLNHQREVVGGHADAFRQAAAIAADAHRAAGRLDIARSAEGLLERPIPGATAAPALTGPEPVLARTTLAQALDRVPAPSGAGRASLRSALTAPATDCSLVATTQRCVPDDLPVVAGLLAAMAEAVVEREPGIGLRLGLEAHVLYAHGSEARLPEMRHNLGRHGPPWARVLLASSRTCEAHGSRDLALDLAAWLGGVAQQLVPFAIIDDVARTVAREGVGWHAELLDRSGDPEAAARARAFATTFDAFG